MLVKILATSRREYPNGRVKGHLIVLTDVGKKRHRINYERDPDGNWRQWGAPTDVLCRTVNHVESLCSPDGFQGSWKAF